MTPSLQPLLRERLDDLLRELLPEGSQLNGSYHHGTRTVHTDEGIWTDSATSQSGDLLDLIADVRHCTLADASTWAADWLAPPPTTPFNPLSVGYKQRHETVWRKGLHAYPYSTTLWNIEFDDGSLRPLQLIDGKPKWKRPKPAPLFLSGRLADNLLPVVIVESEAKALHDLQGHILITWLGGQSSVADADLSPLTEGPPRPIYLYLTGEAATYLKARLPNARIVANPVWPPTLEALATEHQPVTATVPEEPFRLLGIQASVFHYLSYRSGDLIALSPSDHTELNLQLLAPDSYWIAKGHQSDRSTGVDYKQVAKTLIAAQHDLPRYSPDRIRGRGCWLEPVPGAAPRVVFHAGDRLFVNGTPTRFQDHSSPYYYTAGAPLPINLSASLSPDDCSPFLQACDLLPFAPNQLGWILPSACFLGIVCGALDWRPCLWLTGEQGCGKSWIFTNILSRLFGPLCLRGLSSTTEAGIRQHLNNDAFQVIFDEIESKDERARQRIQAILELIRQSASETGGAIIKGSASGHARSYSIRSAFILSSIATTAMEPADEARFAILQFAKSNSPQAAANFQRLNELLDLTVRNPSWVANFHARAISLVTHLRTTIDIFTRAIEAICADSRKGQQFGTLAAGFWLLTSNTPPTFAEAHAWAAQQNWPSLGAGDDLDSDPNRCLDLLLQAKTTYQDNDGKRFDATFADLLTIWTANDLRRDAIHEALTRSGLHLTRSGLHIPTRHPELTRIFQNSPFAARWKDHLARLPNAELVIFKIASRSVRGVRIPVPAEP